ncbi:hypothetical protein PMI54_005241 [Salmonella enterica]|nr:hypothetical protein [Salmonella enterica subsp. diarizonae]EJJ8280736.1 hypothetical protein [Salmonella enterica]EKK3319841.1 hypothetical protein [Salmonella enterica]EKK3319871.1 hypothetical protein [Salmonella enterica]
MLPVVSIPRPAGHGTGDVSAQAWRRCDFTPCLRQFKARPSSRFRGISSPTMRPSVSYSTVGLTRYRTRGTAHRQQGTVSR